MTSSLAEFSNFTKQYRRERVLDDVSFTVEPGEIVALVGPNGAGKSTLLRGLFGFIRATSGSATVAGKPFGRLEQPSAHVGAHFDGMGFETGLTGRRHLRICAVAAGLPSSRVDSIIDEHDIGFLAKKRFGRFSTGMRQRLGLATALLANAPLIVLDEPFNGLDVEAADRILHLLDRHRAAGGSALIATHHLLEVATIATRAVILKKHVIFDGPMADLTDDGAVPFADAYRIKMRSMQTHQGTSLRDKTAMPFDTDRGAHA